MPYDIPATAVVTGAGRGLGREFVLYLARQGSAILATDIDSDTLAETARLATEAGASEIRTMIVDVRDRAQVEAMADAGDALAGGTTLLVNNAGVGVGGPLVGENTGWDLAVGVNLMGVVNGCEVFVPRLKARGRGHVLNVASAAGLLCAPRMAPYNATKAAVIALSETMAVELTGTGVGVTVLCPSFFPTDILDSGHVTEESQGLAQLAMRMSVHSAADIARIGLESSRKGRLVVAPHLDTTMLWWLKRFNPGLEQWVARTFFNADNPVTSRVMSMVLRSGDADAPRTEASSE